MFHQSCLKLLPRLHNWIVCLLLIKLNITQHYVAIKTTPANFINKKKIMNMSEQVFQQFSCLVARPKLKVFTRTFGNISRSFPGKIVRQEKPLDYSKYIFIFYVSCSFIYANEKYPVSSIMY